MFWAHLSNPRQRYTIFPTSPNFLQLFLTIPTTVPGWGPVDGSVGRGCSGAERERIRAVCAVTSCARTCMCVRVLRIRHAPRHTPFFCYYFYFDRCVALCVVSCVVGCVVGCVVDGSEMPMGRGLRCVVGCVVGCAVGCAVGCVAVCSADGSVRQTGGRRGVRQPVGQDCRWAAGMGQPVGHPCRGGGWDIPWDTPARGARGRRLQTAAGGRAQTILETMAIPP